MTENEKMQIVMLQKKGYGAKKIAGILGIPMNRVRSHIRRHPLQEEAHQGCMQCGKPLVQLPQRKERKFCSDKCRMAWWNAHQDQVRRKAYYNLICPRCGESFQSYGKKDRIYCSRKCYAEARQKGADSNG